MVESKSQASSCVGSMIERDDIQRDIPTDIEAAAIAAMEAAAAEGAVPEGSSSLFPPPPDFPELSELSEEALLANESGDGEACPGSADYSLVGSECARRTDLQRLSEQAASIAEQVSENVDFSDVRSLLDISGHSGTLSKALCERNPRLVATVLDPPESHVIGLPSSQQEAYSNCISQSSSCHAEWYDALEINHEAVLLQQSSGSMPEMVVRALCGRAFQGLRPGGLLLVHVFVPEDVSSQPAHSGAVKVKFSSVSAEMVSTGFSDLRQLCLGSNLGHLLVGRKSFEALSTSREVADGVVCQSALR